MHLSLSLYQNTLLRLSKLELAPNGKQYPFLQIHFLTLKLLINNKNIINNRRNFNSDKICDISYANI